MFTKKNLVLMLSYLIIVTCCLSTLFFPAIVYSYERSIRTQQPVEQKQKEFKDRFSLELALSAGYSYNTVTTFYQGPSKSLDIYLKQLGMKYAFNNFAFTLKQSFDILPKRITVFAIFPFAQTTTQSIINGNITFENNKGAFGVGDIAFGGSFFVLTENKNRPKITFFSIFNSNVSKFYPLGNGLWDITLGGKVFKTLKKFEYPTIFNSFYIFGLSNYTFRLNRNGINNGGLVGYGGGFGLEGDPFGVEVQARGNTSNKTTFRGETLFPSQTDVTLSLTISYYEKASVSMFISGLGKGLGLDRNTIGLEVVFPLDIWKWNKKKAKT